MKKYLAIMMCAGLLLTATGCGEEKEEEVSKKDNTKVEEKEKTKNKVLSCSKSYEDQMSMEATFVYDLEGKKISDASISYTIKFDEDEVGDITDEYVNELCDEFKGDESIKSCKAKLNGNKVLADVEYDVDKFDEDEDSFTKDTPIEELKKIMEAEEDEEDSPICKIEEK